MTLTSSSPRYLVQAGAARYGSRDELLGIEYHDVRMTETYAYARKLVVTMCEDFPEDWYEFDARVIDLRTGRPVERTRCHRCGAALAEAQIGRDAHCDGCQELLAEAPALCACGDCDDCMPF
jgi:hypothetical protein